MRHWHHRARGLSHDYALVGYLLAPHPIIQNHARQNMTMQHEEAVSRLITKLILPEDVVGAEREQMRASLVHTFKKEHSDFTNRTGVFAHPDMWVMAEDENVPAWEWWKAYGLVRTKVLGRLACLVVSKNLGIGSAERHWKLVKATKKGQRANLGEEKAKKCALVYGASMQQKSRHRLQKLATAGKLWTDDDFESLKLDIHCREITEAANAVPAKKTRIFRCWEEEWEKVKIGPNGDDVLEARLVRKYGGIKWLDIDNGYRVCEAHPDEMYFDKKRGNNEYLVFTIYHGFDFDKDLAEQKDKYDNWEKNDDLYELIYDYYKDSKEVKVYLKGGECESESDGEE